jgi:hypothetical protein
MVFMRLGRKDCNVASNDANAKKLSSKLPSSEKTMGFGWDGRREQQ